MAAPETDTAPLAGGLPPIHPGAILREDVLPALKAEGVSKVAVAQALGISRRTLEDLVLEKAAVTAEMALRLGKYLGNGPTVWLGLQREWDLAQAQDKIGAQVAAIPTYRLRAETVAFQVTGQRVMGHIGNPGLEVSSPASALAARPTPARGSRGDVGRRPVSKRSS